MTPEWPRIPLAQLADRITTRNTAGEQNVLTISARHGLVGQQKYFNKLVASESLSGYYYLERGDFAYNKSHSDGYPFGAIKRLDKSPSGVVSPLYICFRPKASEAVCSDYLVHYFESGLMDEDLRTVAMQGARDHGLLNVRPADFFALPVVAPPLAEQRKIAAILSSIDDAIEATQAVIDQLGVVKRAMMAELLTRGLPGRHTKFKQTEIGEVPEGWDVVPLECVCERMFVGIAQAATHAYVRDGGVPIIRTTNLRENRLRMDELLRISKDFALEMRSKSLRVGDVLSARTGYPGTSVVVPKTLDGAQCFTLLVSRPGPRILSQYLCDVMNSSHGERIVAQGQAGGAQQNLNVSVLGAAMIPLPPMDEQRNIAAAIDGLYRREDAEMSVMNGLASLKHSLMSVLLTGELRVKPDEVVP